MHRVLSSLLGIVMTGVLGALCVAPAAQDQKPKFTIAEVMDQAHSKTGLLKKVMSGQSSKAEKEELVGLYTALTLNKPPKGDPKSFKEKAGALLEGAKAAVKDEKDGIAKLKKAANCKACHEAHRED
jgi:hypothetical protein